MTLLQHSPELPSVTDAPTLEYTRVLDEICRLDWPHLSREEMVSAAWAYYYFSIQFRENLKIARSQYPGDKDLERLEAEECNTSNLSPWPDVAAEGEKMDHDEYMRRTVQLEPIDVGKARHFAAAGEAYLAEVRSLDHAARAASIVSYEDGGLEAVFRAFLTFPTWDTPLLRAFEHFLAEHIRFDSDPDQGHGALSRRIKLDDNVLPLWQGFKRILLACVPSLQPADGLRAAAE